MGKKSKIIMGLATAAMIPAILTGCGHKEHDPKDEWQNDATYHWQECEEAKCEEQLNKAEHQATGNWVSTETHHYKDCDNCGYDMGLEEHESSATYSSNETHHWHECVDCGYVLNKVQHAYDQEVATSTYLKTTATTTTKAVYYKSCVCGKKGADTDTFESGLKLGEISNLAISGKTYDGTAVSVPTYDKNTDGTVKVEYKVKNADDNTYTTTAPINAGEYTVRVSIAESANYTSVSQTKDFTISKFVLSDLNKVFTYNGQAVHIVRLPKAMNLPDENVDMVMTFASANAGASVSSVKVLVNHVESGNYEVVNCNASINKATPSFSNVAMSSAMITYGDNYNAQYQSIDNFYETSTNGFIVEEYYVGSEWTTERPTDAGNYKARFRVLASTNYNEVISDEVEYGIQAYKIQNKSTTVTYNGTLYHIVNLDEIEDGLRLDITFNQESVEGSYPTAVNITLDGQPTSNYELDTHTCTVEMVKKKVSLEWASDLTLEFDLTEKEPTVNVAEGDLCGEDSCEVITINKVDGDNVWYGSTCTFEASELSNPNYDLPDNRTSPEYTITTLEDTATVGEEINVGSASFCPNDTLFVSMAFDQGYYYFDYISSEQGESLSFILYKKGGDLTPIASFYVGDQNKKSQAFNITTAGDYCLKVVASSGTQYEKLIIRLDDHSEINEYGHCIYCGAYQGDTIEIGDPVTLSLEKGEKAYYRFAYSYDKCYSRTYTSPLQGGDMSFYMLDNNGDFNPLDFTNNAKDFGTPFDNYFYIVITANATFENGSFTIFEKNTED